jgi:hypothetical protein
MKIEFGFQANCSELVAHLGGETIEEVIDAMRRIEEITGWKWCLMYEQEDVPVPEDHPGPEKSMELCSYLQLPMDRLDEFLLIDTEPDGFRYIRIRTGPVKELLVSLDALPDTTTYFGKGILEDRYPSDQINLVRTDVDEGVFQTNEYDHWVQPTMDCEYNGPRGFGVACSTELGLFPGLEAFHEIRKSFGAPWHGHDGGNFSYYYDWMAVHFIKGFDPDGLSVNGELWKKLDMRKLEMYKSNPPLEGSAGIDDEDFKIIAEWLKIAPMAVRYSWWKKLKTKERKA